MLLPTGSLVSVEAAYNEFYRSSRELHKEKIDAEHT